MSGIRYCNFEDPHWFWMIISSAVALAFGVCCVLLYRFLDYLVRFVQSISKRKKWKRSNANNSNSTGHASKSEANNNNNNLAQSQRGLHNSGLSNNTEEESVNIEIPTIDLDYIKVDISCITEAKDWAGSLISGQSLSGRMMLVFIFIISVGSVVLYINETRWVSKNRIERCDEWATSIEQQIDFSFNLIFFVYFFVRFIAANDKLWFFFELHSLVDILTVPPAFLSMIMSRNWIGLRFIRSLRLMSLPDILQYLNVARSSTTIRLMQLITLFLTLVLTTAGFIHLVENSGDPPLYKNAQNLTYFDSIYYMVVTFSTVGFGDIKVVTVTGKAFMLMFILGGLAVFANSLPEIADIVSTRNKYSGTYKKEKPHIVLCGHITYDTVLNFLSDFLHKDREDSDVEIVILDNQEPNLEMESILKRYNIQVKFFKGSVMNSRDLDRVYLDQADCCLVLTNKYSNDPDSEDAANIMRVISIKNFSSEIKVIIQLIQYHNKAYLLNIPNWRLQGGDDVVCLAELKLGFMAVSCMAPGFSTLIANLFTMRSFKNDLRIPTWQNEYLEGAGMELYSEYFSTDFLGLTFLDAVVLAYEKLNLLLIAVQMNNSIIINPDKSTVTISQPGTQGFFIAQSSEEVKRAFYYCSRCHGNLNNPDLIKPCCCDSAKMARNKVIAHQLQRRNTTISLTSNVSQQIRHHHHQHHKQTSPTTATAAAGNEVKIKKRSTRAASLALPVQDHNEADDYFLKLPTAYGSLLLNRNDQQQQQHHQDQNQQRQHEQRGAQQISDLPSSAAASGNTGCLNITGSFYWIPDVSIEDAVLTPQKIQNDSSMLYHHIIVCLFAESMSPLIGLRNFLFPLRSAHIAFQELIPVIVIGSIDYIKREWKTLMNFPKLYLFLGSPLNRMVLRTVRIDRCGMCVILSAKQSMNVDEQSLVDKEAILCSLNIKAMRFDGGGTFNSIWQAGSDVPLITELAIDSNVQFLDQDDEDDPDGEIFMAQPFACGTVFTVSVLDSMMSTAYFNEDALGLIRTLVSGGMTLEFEQLLAEGTGFKGFSQRANVDNNDDTVDNNDSSTDRPGQLKLLPVNRDPLSKCGIMNSSQKILYGEFLMNSVRMFGIICIGIFRRIDIYEVDAVESQSDINSDNHDTESIADNPCKRYVITNPSPNMAVYKSDLVYCLTSDSRFWNSESDT